jgi:hypothetical protein
MKRAKYFVYGAAIDPKPLDPGTALYARVHESDHLYSDYRWDLASGSWEINEYLGHLMVTGAVDIENVDVADILANVTKL